MQRQALLMTGGGLADTTIATIATAVGTIKADTDAGKLNRVKAAWLLLMATPEYQVQK